MAEYLSSSTTRQSRVRSLTQHSYSLSITTADPLQHLIGWWCGLQRTLFRSTDLYRLKTSQLLPFDLVNYIAMASRQKLNARDLVLGAVRNSPVHTERGKSLRRFPLILSFLKGALLLNLYLEGATLTCEPKDLRTDSDIGCEVNLANVPDWVRPVTRPSYKSRI